MPQGSPFRITQLTFVVPLQMYQVGQRGQDPSGGPNSSHHYQRHDGGDADADAEGERDYEVG